MKQDLMSAGVAVALGSAFLIGAVSMPLTPGQSYGAGFLPALVAGVLIVAGMALALRTFYRTGEQALRPAPLHWLGGVLIVAMLVAYITLADIVGFHLTAGVGTAILIYAFSRRITSSLLTAVVAVIVTHLTFYNLFKVPLPWGILRTVSW
ncbi:tripartite tricarboxylate transporter TctB family protein [Pollutimonas sp. H1-120]|uniref:tripartite tricarboxylate transporter TctB family protein n=1 Tax=Pollutimonas sp. H1-120 TaxID=3148824 RepID=UPI003B52402B